MDETAPDVVCLDVLMPGMDGVSLLKRIREKHEDSRVVMITGEARAEVVKEALALGARGFVVKPFSAAKVLHAIRQALA
jgi:two-component system chemotaxis response regulator CheY